MSGEYINAYVRDKFDVSIILTSQVIDCQLHVIGNAIRPLFTDLVTIYG